MIINDHIMKTRIRSSTKFGQFVEVTLEIRGIIRGVGRAPADCRADRWSISRSSAITGRNIELHEHRIRSSSRDRIRIAAPAAIRRSEVNPTWSIDREPTSTCNSLQSELEVDRELSQPSDRK